MQTLKNKFQLNIAATPIGNLEEISNRFLRVINEMDILLCEDTRVTKKLINLLGIEKQFIYQKFDMFSENNNLQPIIEQIKSGKRIMLLSDAGYPTISDPGYLLVNECIKEKIAINVVNGPCSLIHALVGSGFSSREFIFLGFIGKTKTDRIKKLNEYKNISNTFVILESVHRLKDTLQDLYSVFGNQRICIAKELTKMYEEFIYSTLEEIQNIEFDLKGEFVLVIDKINEQNNSVDVKDIELEIIKLLKDGIRTKDISSYIAEKYNLDKKEWYKKILYLQSNNKEK